MIPFALDFHLDQIKPGDVQVKCKDLSSIWAGRRQPVLSIGFDGQFVHVHARNANLRQIRDTIDAYLATEDSCPANGDRRNGTSTPCSETAPICDGTCFPLPATFIVEATTEPGEIVSSIPSDSEPLSTCS